MEAYKNYLYRYNSSIEGFNYYNFKRKKKTNTFIGYCNS